MNCDFEKREFDKKLLRSFALECFTALSKNVVVVPYPDVVLTKTGKNHWHHHEKSIGSALAPILDEVSGRGGVYIILTDSSDGTFCPQYIGHANQNTVRQRIRNHLIKKHDKTGAQLENVKHHISSRSRIGFSFVEIKPVGLRLFVEDWLIDTIGPHWNINGTKRFKAGAKYPARYRQWTLAEDS